MDAGIISALIGAGATLIVPAIAIMHARASAAKARHEAAIAKVTSDSAAIQARMEAKIEKLEDALAIRTETVDELRSQRDRLQVTADLQDRFWRQLDTKLGRDDARRSV